jgi:hypothetical protein
MPMERCPRSRFATSLNPWGETIVLGFKEYVSVKREPVTIIAFAERLTLWLSLLQFYDIEEGRDDEEDDQRTSESILPLKWSPIPPTVKVRHPFDSPLEACAAHQQDEREDFAIGAFGQAENGAFHPVAAHDASIVYVGGPHVAFPDSVPDVSTFPMGGYQMPDVFHSQERSSSFHGHGDSLHVFDRQPKEGANESSQEANLASGVLCDFRAGTGSHTTGFGENLESQLQVSRGNNETSLKPSAAGPNPRIINTPHGPALLLNPPALHANAASPSMKSPGRQRKFQRWSEEEDAILRYAVSSEEESKPNWKKISTTFFASTRTALQCKSRWTKSLQPGLQLGSWQEHEDDIIRHLRAEGFKWAQIAEQLPGRIGEHVRDRYVNFLDPDLKKTPWTKEEDKILYEQQKLQGNKWTLIANFLPGRSENAVKNRWHNAKMTQRRRMRKHAAERSLVAQSMRARQHAATAGSEDESRNAEEDSLGVEV